MYEGQCFSEWYGLKSMVSIVLCSVQHYLHSFVWYCAFPMIRDLFFAPAFTIANTSLMMIVFGLRPIRWRVLRFVTTAMMIMMITGRFDHNWQTGNRSDSTCSVGYSLIQHGNSCNAKNPPHCKAFCQRFKYHPFSLPYDIEDHAAASFHSAFLLRNEAYPCDGQAYGYCSRRRHYWGVCHSFRWSALFWEIRECFLLLWIQCEPSSGSVHFRVQRSGWDETPASASWFWWWSPHANRSHANSRLQGENHHAVHRRNTSEFVFVSHLIDRSDGRWKEWQC